MAVIVEEEMAFTGGVRGGQAQADLILRVEIEWEGWAHRLGKHTEVCEQAVCIVVGRLSRN